MYDKDRPKRIIKKLEKSGKFFRPVHKRGRPRLKMTEDCAYHQTCVFDLNCERLKRCVDGK